MKKLLLLFLLPFFASCVTNYYYVTLDNDTPYYSGKDETKDALYTIPANTPVYISGKPGKYRKVKYNDYVGFVVNPTYTAAAPENTSIAPTTQYRNSSTSTSTAPKTVHVKGYTRKDGTYVKPHTRSAPRKRKG